MDNIVAATPATTTVPDSISAIPSDAPVTAPASVTPSSSMTGGWKSTVNTDLRNSPLLSKFEDTPDGLNKALESHANLEKLLGHEKVPIPKDVNDVEGWNRFSKAMGIPDKAEGYGLSDASIPDSMKGITLDKNKFAEIAHAHKLTPAQAKGLWETYTRENVSSYDAAMKAHQEQMTTTVNTLKGEWGDAYQTNVELGQMVINKFSNDQETNDYITSVLSKDPKGIKFLAKIGDQFAENKMGDFQMKRFSLGPEEAQNQIDKIKNDPNHPYMNPKATAREHQAAIDHVNSLYATITRAKNQ
jgi:hypothetical protein